MRVVRGTAPFAGNNAIFLCDLDGADDISAAAAILDRNSSRANTRWRVLTRNTILWPEHHAGHDYDRRNCLARGNHTSAKLRREWANAFGPASRSRRRGAARAGGRASGASAAPP